ncbi:MAG TPA: ring-cleaving dioxygenase [Ktedonobacterales bacterium]|jgi:glyoxalase family protein
MELGGIHHITAITGHASQNVAFYTQVLGMRLVKKTVNQDDVSAYHLFYGDEIGHPGTELTFFDWPLAGENRPGVGTISAIAFGVRGRAALEWWEQRLERFQVAHDGIQTRGADERAVLAFRDPEGQRLELIDDGGRMAGQPWKGSPVPAEMGIRGLYAVRLTLRETGPSARLLTETLGFRQGGTYQSAEQHTVTVFEVGPGGPGTEVHLEARPDVPHGRPGIGGVHHVAFRTPDDEEQRLWRARVVEAGRQVTPFINRFYFHSIYFREPGGVLFEIATDGPGFATDEDPEHLGEALALPPFLEGHRKEIEAGLRPITPYTFAMAE